ncbi:MAG TPA: hypothetical protein VMU51_00475 [Mycobacteriales bacterium]|jgi:hypothetical protein|nr:hypothetical protein [Mycobacteriales bacterium]
MATGSAPSKVVPAENTGLVSWLEKQVELLRARDGAGLANRYHEDAVLLRFDKVAHGRDEIRDTLLEWTSSKPVIEDGWVTATGPDFLVYEAIEHVDGEQLTAIGTMVFRDGLLWRQTVAFV